MRYWKCRVKYFICLWSWGQYNSPILCQAIWLPTTPSTRHSNMADPPFVALTTALTATILGAPFWLSVSHIKNQKKVKLKIFIYFIDWMVEYCVTSCVGKYFIHMEPLPLPLSVKFQSKNLGLWLGLTDGLYIKQGGIFIVPPGFGFCGLVRRTVLFKSTNVWQARNTEDLF